MASGISGRSRDWAVVFVVGLLSISCIDKRPSVAVDFPQIEQRKVIDVLTLSGSMSYFIYKGEPRGYEYELLRDFVDAYGWEVHIRLAENET
jgi:membrane-bound lytic murein transglycosylase F